MGPQVRRRDGLDPWALSGVRKENGDLERPAGYGSWLLPAHIRLDGDHLVWRGRGEQKDHDPRRKAGGRSILEQFVRLADAPADRILGYAQTWGVLQLCRHDKPMTHVPPWVWADFEQDDYQPCRPIGLRAFREPLERWRFFSSQANAILGIGSSLRSDRPAERESWDVLESLYAPGVMKAVLKGSDAHQQRRLLASAIDHWLQMGAVNVQFRWDSDLSRIDLGGGSLFGALALQIALAVGGRDGLAVCDSCRCVYMPVRHNGPGAVRRCSDCGVKESKRVHAAKRRAQERALRGQGIA